MTNAKPRGRPYGGAITAAQRAATGLHSWIYRATNGRLGGRLAGGPILLLTTPGRKSGEKERLWPKLVQMYGGYEGYRRRTDREIPVVKLRPQGDGQA